MIMISKIRLHTCYAVIIMAILIAAETLAFCVMCGEQWDHVLGQYHKKVPEYVSAATCYATGVTTVTGKYVLTCEYTVVHGDDVFNATMFVDDTYRLDAIEQSAKKKCAKSHSFRCKYDSMLGVIKEIDVPMHRLAKNVHLCNDWGLSNMIVHAVFIAGTILIFLAVLGEESDERDRQRREQEEEEEQNQPVAHQTTQPTASHHAVVLNNLATAPPPPPRPTYTPLYALQEGLPYPYQQQQPQVVIPMDDRPNRTYKIPYFMEEMTLH